MTTLFPTVSAVQTHYSQSYIYLKIKKLFVSAFQCGFHYGCSLQNLYEKTCFIYTGDVLEVGLTALKYGKLLL